MNLLALDLGTKCGWCRTDGGIYHSGVWDLSIGRFEGGGMRFLRFHEMLNSVLEHVDRVAYEEVRGHRGVDAAHVYGGLQAVLTQECERRVIPYESIPVSHIKRHATGSGNANKSAMIAAAREVWPHIVIVDDNQADAMHIAHFVASRNGRHQ